jgi:hypothetical protein
MIDQMSGYQEGGSTSARNGKLGNEFLLAEFAVDVYFEFKW